MSTLFTRIIEGELPGTFVWRDDLCVGFMSINPITSGHALVVPIEEVDHWTDASSDLAAHLMRVSHTVGKAVKSAFEPERVAMMIAGLEVPHLHLHVLGINELHDMSFANAAKTVDPDQLEQNAERIRAALRQAGELGVSS